MNLKIWKLVDDMWACIYDGAYEDMPEQCREGVALVDASDIKIVAYVGGGFANEDGTRAYYLDGRSDFISLRKMRKTAPYD